MSIMVITHIVNELDRIGLPTGKKKLVASHGVDIDTDRIVIMPNEHPTQLGAVFDDEYMEYIIW